MEIQPRIKSRTVLIKSSFMIFSSDSHWSSSFLNFNFYYLCYSPTPNYKNCHCITQVFPCVFYSFMQSIAFYLPGVSTYSPCNINLHRDFSHNPWRSVFLYGMSFLILLFEVISLSQVLQTCVVISCIEGTQSLNKYVRQPSIILNYFIMFICGSGTFCPLFNPSFL